MKPAKLFMALCLLVFAQGVFAQTIGTVGKLSGVLLVRDADGRTRALAENSQLRQGDTLATQRNSWAALTFVDGAELTLQPDSMLVLTRYAYDPANPQQDKVELGLAQGGFRSAVGLLGQRSKDATTITTPAGVLKGSASMVVSLQQP
jgi:hypothetical protein